MPEQQRIKILFFSANPKGMANLNVDEEIKTFLSTGDTFEIKNCPATTYHDLVEQIMSSKVHIVHFAGHGCGQPLEKDNQQEDKSSRQFVPFDPQKTALILEDEKGKPSPVTIEGLARIFERSKQRQQKDRWDKKVMNCVLLNACYSHELAKAIAQHIPYVIGMGNAINDLDAINFTKYFYKDLERQLEEGDKIDYKDAYDYACLQINPSGKLENDIPKFFAKEEKQTSTPLLSSLSEQDKRYQGYKKIKDQLIDVGGIVPFLGAGINPEFYTKLVEELKKDLQKEIFPEIMGLPCQVCPYLPKDRPAECPLCGKVPPDSHKTPIYTGQSLAITTMQLRYFTQYCYLESGFKALNGKLERLLNHIPEEIKSSSPKEIHRFLPKLIRKLSYLSDVKKPIFPLIITTNYDHLLEKAFEEEGQPYDLIYYSLDVNELGQYKYKAYGQKNIKIIDKNEPKDPPPHSIILKLYGTLDTYDSLAITQDQINRLVSNSLTNLPYIVTRIFKDKPILFIGYSPGNSELQLVVNKLCNLEGFDYKLSQNSCLIHQANIGGLEDKYWGERGQKGVTLIALDSNEEGDYESKWDEFASDFLKQFDH